jgi:hypothetical protein
MLTGRFSAVRFRAVASVPEKAEAVKVDAPARRTFGYLHDVSHRPLRIAVRARRKPSP